MLTPKFFVVALPILLASPMAAADTLKLDCKASDGVTTEPLKIDFGTDTVTFGLGWPTSAVVTDDTISWPSRVDAKDVTYTLYRKRGELDRTFKSDAPDFDRGGQFTCQPHPERRYRPPQ